MPFRFAPSASFKRWPIRLVLISIPALIVIALMAFTARAWRIKNSDFAKPVADAGAPVTSGPLSQPNASARSHLNGRLALQPEADKLRRRLGQRFLVRGREVSVLVGTLLVGAERYTARITRSQDDDDERLTIALSGQQETITWSGLDGAKSNGNAVTGNLRSLIERIALDSPDQFVLAQLRGAAYFTIARSVRPAEAGGSDAYTGPVWDLVRIAEPTENSQNRPQSQWRLFYINTSTGLIDRIVSQEQGTTITAEFSNWVNQGGELIPARVIWKAGNQVVMDLTISNVSHNSKQ